MAADGLGSEQKRVSLPILVAPSTDTDLTNTVEPALVPLACWRFEDGHFAFDSSVINPATKPEMAKFQRLWMSSGKAALSLFGHADPVGDDEYNKTLSGRRVTAMYGLLTRNVDLWEQLYSQPFSSDNWANNGALPLMRQTTGQPDSAARKDVYAAYMDWICQDSNGQPFAIDKSGFLGGGKDSGGKADYQGCGEFNPILLFSQSEATALESNQAERNRENQPNRRVMIFMFLPGLSIDPAKWPCPRAQEGTTGCRTLFWPDGDQRRANGDQRREYQTDKRTFACAFYDAMARRSPCELVRKTIQLRILDIDKSPFANAEYRLALGDYDLRKGTTDVQGWFTEADVIAPKVVTLEWATTDGRQNNDGDYTYRLDLVLEIPQGSDEDVARVQLHNLGYMPAVLEDALRAFQNDYGIVPADGQLDDNTKQKLKTANDQQLAKGEL